MANSDLDGYFTAIGKLSTAWAIAEYGLDQCVSCIFYNFGGDTIEPAAPRTAKQKIKFFRKAFATSPQLSSARAIAIKISDHFSTTLLMRNWCIHGFAQNAFSGGLPENIRLTRLALADMKTFEETHVTLKDIEKCYSDSTELCIAFGLILYKPLNVLPEDHIKNLFSSFGVEIASVFPATQNPA